MDVAQSMLKGDATKNLFRQNHKDLLKKRWEKISEKCENRRDGDWRKECEKGEFDCN